MYFTNYDAEFFKFSKLFVAVMSLSNNFTNQIYQITSFQ